MCWEGGKVQLLFRHLAQRESFLDFPNLLLRELSRNFCQYWDNCRRLGPKTGRSSSWWSETIGAEHTVEASNGTASQVPSGGSSLKLHTCGQSPGGHWVNSKYSSAAILENGSKKCSGEYQTSIFSMQKHVSATVFNGNGLSSEKPAKF